MTRSPVDANQCSSRSARVQATVGPASERPASGFVRTKRERRDAPTPALRRVPADAAAILGRAGTRLQGGDGLEFRSSRGHRRAWNHDRPGRDHRTHLRRRDRQRRRESGSGYIPRQAIRHIIPAPRPTRPERPPRRHSCRGSSAANGELSAGSPSPWC